MCRFEVNTSGVSLYRCAIQPYYKSRRRPSNGNPFLRDHQHVQECRINLLAVFCGRKRFGYRDDENPRAPCLQIIPTLGPKVDKSGYLERKGFFHDCHKLPFLQPL